MSFKDHFSRQAAAYRRYRPGYPEGLFAALAELAPSRRLAWDCGCGSGQAALGLAPHFARVLATDPSAKQLAHAARAPAIGYARARAEAAPLPAAAVDLVVVAQALHWFDRPGFFAEVERVLRDGGVLAVWSYNLLRVDEAVDRLIARLYGELLGPYWPPERRLVEEGYRGIDFPFEPLPTPPFAMQAQWEVEQLLGYLGTWSAVAAYRAATGRDPVDEVEAALRRAWGARRRKTVSWPLRLLVGRKQGGRGRLCDTEMES